MKISKYITLILLLGLTSITYAADTSSVKFYYSNNSGEIPLDQAFTRLTTKPQKELTNRSINILQNNHIEQGRFENILGSYQMADMKITGDNTEIFRASPLQKLSNEQVFLVATDLAKALEQESVAVFIPSDQYAVSDVCVHFAKNNEPSISEVINIVQKKLPTYYSGAFSLHLKNKKDGFNQAKVDSIEWLGSNKNVNDIKKAFPGENITYQNGQTYLVYKSGQVERL